MLSQSLSLRGTPCNTSAQKLSAFPCRAPSVAARPDRRRPLYVASAEASPSEQKVRIKLKAYELPLLQHSIAVIQEAAERTGIEQEVSGLSAFCACHSAHFNMMLLAGANASGPVPLPTRIRKYTVLRSPHVNKDSREQFETRTHQRLFEFHDPSAATIDALMDVDVPAGVDVAVSLGGRLL